ncbi:MAG: hypothetical protein ACFFDT_23285 [Candidatus Hodarchaeota archaeon]
MPHGLRSLKILPKPPKTISSKGMANPLSGLPLFSRKLELISFIWDIIQIGIFISCLIGTILAVVFNPWIYDNLLAPDTPAYTVSDNINLKFNQIWYEPNKDLTFSRGGIIGINWVSNGYLDFYIFDEENFLLFQESDNRLYGDFQPLFDVRGEKNLTINVQLSVSERYYILWHYSTENFDENLKNEIDQLYISFTIHFPPSSKIVISLMFFLVIFILLLYFVLFLFVSLKKYAISPVIKELEGEGESLVEKKAIQQPQLCSNCYKIILANETSCSKCGRFKFMEKE